MRYLHEAGYSVNGQIGCTQPRRVAAVPGAQSCAVCVSFLSGSPESGPNRSVAKRVADEMGCELGTKAQAMQSKVD